MSHRSSKQQSWELKPARSTALRETTGGEGSRQILGLSTVGKGSTPARSREQEAQDNAATREEPGEALVPPGEVVALSLRLLSGQDGGSEPQPPGFPWRGGTSQPWSLAPELQPRIWVGAKPG